MIVCVAGGDALMIWFVDSSVLAARITFTQDELSKGFPLNGPLMNFLHKLISCPRGSAPGGQYTAFIGMSIRNSHAAPHAVDDDTIDLTPSSSIFCSSSPPLHTLHIPTPLVTGLLLLWLFIYTPN